MIFHFLFKEVCNSLNMSQKWCTKNWTFMAFLWFLNMIVFFALLNSPAPYLVRLSWFPLHIWHKCITHTTLASESEATSCFSAHFWIIQHRSTRKRCGTKYSIQTDILHFKGSNSTAFPLPLNWYISSIPASFIIKYPLDSWKNSLYGKDFHVFFMAW